MRILLAGILGGIVMFVGHRSRIWRYHWAKLINEIPNESAVLNAMQSSMGNGINFHYPVIFKLT